MSEPEPEPEFLFYKFIPNILGTTERWRARFNVVYQVQNAKHFMSKANATPDDIEKYIAAHPVEGERLRNINKASTVSGLGGIVGLVGGAWKVRQVTKSVPTLLVGTAMSAVTLTLVCDDIASWVYGTYKMDMAGEAEKAARWIYENKKNEKSGEIK